MLFKRSNKASKSVIDSASIPICRQCQEANRTMNECGISDLQDRSALRDVLQMNMELDLNLGTVIQAYDKQKIDTKDIQQVRSKLLAQRGASVTISTVDSSSVYLECASVVLYHLAQWLERPRKPFDISIKRRNLNAVQPTCHDLQSVPITFDWLADIASKLDHHQPATPEGTVDKPPEYRLETTWSVASRNAAMVSVPFKFGEREAANFEPIQWQDTRSTYLYFGE